MNVLERWERWERWERQEKAGLHSEIEPRRTGRRLPPSRVWSHDGRGDEVFSRPLQGAMPECPMGSDFTYVAASAGFVHRSDHGMQDVSIKYTERLADAGIEPSVGSVETSCDNALADTIDGLYETDVIRQRRPWPSFEAVEFAPPEWVDWFDNRRLIKPTGNTPPAEAEERRYAQLEAINIAAQGATQPASGKPDAVQNIN